MEDISRNVCFFQVRISLILRLIQFVTYLLTLPHIISRSLSIHLTLLLLRSDILTTVMKILVFWVVTPCSLVQLH
jgi:hypothetical protein